MMTYTNEYMQYTISTDHFHVAKLHIFFTLQIGRYSFFEKGKIIYHFLKKRKKFSNSNPPNIPTKILAPSQQENPERIPNESRRKQQPRQNNPSTHSTNPLIP